MNNRNFKGRAMNILYHHRTQGTGAEGVHIAYVIKGLRALGHGVDVASPTDKEPSSSAGNSPYAKRVGIKSNVLNFISRILPQFGFELLEIFYNFSAIRNLEKKMQNKKYQFIYERQAFFLFAGAHIARKHSLPFIVEVNEVAGEQRVRQQVFTAIAKKIERKVFNQADAIIVVSEHLKQKIEELGVDGSKIHIVENGVDEAMFDIALDEAPIRAAHQAEKNTVVIGFVGWFVAWHKLDKLIDAIAMLDGDQSVQLWLVGEGDLKQSLIDRALACGIKNNLIFTGAIPYKEIPKYLKAMDICVIPDSNEYRSPIKMFEYMAMAKTVVAPAYEPITKVINDGVDGVIFPPQDWDSLASILNRIVKDSVLREEIGIRAREKILSKYLWINNAKKVINIYHNFDGSEVDGSDCESHSIGQ
jgi:glycosyltransferase involved in cell wall biosynthesis